MDFAVSLVSKLINWVWRIFWIRIVPILIQGFVFSAKAALYASAAVWVGWGPATKRITDEWMKRIAIAGIPSSVDPYMRPLSQAVAFFLILLGWVFLAVFTATLINTLLRHYTGHWINF